MKKEKTHQEEKFASEDLTLWWVITKIKKKLTKPLIKMDGSIQEISVSLDPTDLLKLLTERKISLN